jgi:outer membrane protein OmpA-like peptidoglycan-associated protein
MSVLAGCSTSSGPTFNIYEVQTNSGAKAYRVDCHGLFEGASACMQAAQRFCGDQPVHQLATMELLLAPSESATDPRISVFQCATPVQPQAAAPAPVAAPPQAAPVEMPRQINLSGDANFATNSAVLTPKARATLDEFVAAGKTVTLRTVAVAGYTDSTGSASLNRSLSERRARSVANYLKSNGLRAESFQVKGYGPADPVASNATAEGRAQNRRVEVKVSAQ